MQLLIRKTAPTPLEKFYGVGGTSDRGYGRGYLDISGNRVNGAPRYTANLTVQHQHEKAHLKWAVFNSL